MTQSRILLIDLDNTCASIYCIKLLQNFNTTVKLARLARSDHHFAADSHLTHVTESNTKQNAFSFLLENFVWFQDKHKISEN